MTHFQGFAKDVPISVRVSEVAPVINASLESFDAGLVTIGAETFSEEIIGRIDAAGLLDKNQWVDVEFVAVHPDNREKAMVVPVDAHQLLKAICGNGWSWTKWNALASEVPPTSIGKEWCNKNKEHADASDGLLPTFNPDKIKILTGRGSHGTSAVRIMRFAAIGIHPEMCSEDGTVSMSKIIDRQPSMKEPCTRVGVHMM